MVFINCYPIVPSKLNHSISVRQKRLRSCQSSIFVLHCSRQLSCDYVQAGSRAATDSCTKHTRSIVGTGAVDCGAKEHQSLANYLEQCVGKFRKSHRTTGRITLTVTNHEVPPTFPIETYEIKKMVSWFYTFLLVMGLCLYSNTVDIQAY